MSVSISWMRRPYKKLREVKKKLEEDSKKGLWYESGMVGPHHARESSQNNKGIANKVVIPHCSPCQSDTHQHKMSKLCTSNPNNIAIRQAQLEKGKRGKTEGKCDTKSNAVPSK
jgi:hypothetical protein